MAASGLWEQPCSCSWYDGVPMHRCAVHGAFLRKPAPSEGSEELDSVVFLEDDVGTFLETGGLKDNRDLDMTNADCQIKYAILPPGSCCLHGFGVYYMSARERSTRATLLKRPQ